MELSGWTVLHLGSCDEGSSSHVGLRMTANGGAGNELQHSCCQLQADWRRCCSFHKAPLHLQAHLHQHVLQACCSCPAWPAFS